MVKSRGGTKTKIPIEKIGKQSSLAVACSKRRRGLFSKASQLCLLSGGAQIAVLATPASSNSGASFYSFGHSSVDSIVSAFLSGSRPLPVREEPMETDLGICLARRDLGLDSWWEDESLRRSENLDELTEAINRVSSLLTQCKDLRSNHQRDMKRKDKEKMEQTLIPQSDSPIGCIPDDIVGFSPDQTLIRQSDDSPIGRIPDEIVGFSPSITEEQSQILALCESFCVTEEENSNNNNMDRALTGTCLDQEMEIDQFIDYETEIDAKALEEWLLEVDQEEETVESLLMNCEEVSTNPNPISDSQLFDASAFENWPIMEESNQENTMGALNQVNLCFFDSFNKIAAV